MQEPFGSFQKHRRVDLVGCTAVSHQGPLGSRPFLIIHILNGAKSNNTFCSNIMCNQLLAPSVQKAEVGTYVSWVPGQVYRRTVGSG